MPIQSTPSSSPDNSSTEVHEFINREEQARNNATFATDDEKSRNMAAAERYAELSLKSRPLPEGFDQSRRATVGDAVKTIKPEDFLRVHQTPCGRDGGLAFILGGAGVGGLRFMFGAPIMKATNWAVFGGAAISIASFEYCQYKRRKEKANMKRVVEVVTKKQAEQKRLGDEQKRQEQITPEPRTHAEAPKASHKSWYKFW